VKEGAHIVSVDLNADAAKATSKEITDKYGLGIGVAGTGISNCGPAIWSLLQYHRPSEHSRNALNRLCSLMAGSITIIVTAGYFCAPDKTGHIPDDKWAAHIQHQRHRQLSGGRRSSQDLERTGLERKFDLTTSANAVVSKKGSVPTMFPRPPGIISFENWRSNFLRWSV